MSRPVCEQGECRAEGACATGDCVRGALRRLLMVAAVLMAVALGTAQWAWLMLAGLLLFTAAMLWIMDKVPARNGA